MLAFINEVATSEFFTIARIVQEMVLDPLTPGPEKINHGQFAQLEEITQFAKVLEAVEKPSLA